MAQVVYHCQQRCVRVRNTLCCGGLLRFDSPERSSQLLSKRVVNVYCRLCKFRNLSSWKLVSFCCASFASVSVLWWLNGRLFCLQLAASALMSAASAALVVALIARHGQSSAGWNSWCGYVSRFCDYAQGAIISSFIGFAFLALSTILAASALHHLAWRRLP